MKKLGLIPVIVLLLVAAAAVVWWRVDGHPPALVSSELAPAVEESAAPEATALPDSPVARVAPPRAETPETPAPHSAPAVAEEPVRRPRQRPDVPGGVLTMTRGVPAGGYTPGEPLELELGLEYDAGAFPITALGLVEQLPAGWTYDGVVSGPAPVLQPPLGHPGPLEFAWIEVPSFPAVFSYRVRVPSGERETRTISGMSMYRTDGPQAETPEVLTAISVLTP